MVVLASVIMGGSLGAVVQKLSDSMPFILTIAANNSRMVGSISRRADFVVRKINSNVMKLFDCRL